jgi:hypothetical protein
MVGCGIVHGSNHCTQSLPKVVASISGIDGIQKHKMLQITDLEDDAA